MRFNLNNKEVQISIHHMSYVDFKKNYPGLVKHSPKKSKKVTVAELIYDNCRSVASSHVHKNELLSNIQNLRNREIKLYEKKYLTRCFGASLRPIMS